jgi:hypothetical protein
MTGTGTEENRRKRHRMEEEEVATLSNNELHVTRIFAFGLGSAEAESK